VLDVESEGTLGRRREPKVERSTSSRSFVAPLLARSVVDRPPSDLVPVREPGSPTRGASGECRAESYTLEGATGLCRPVSRRAPESDPLERADSRVGGAYTREGASEALRLGTSWARPPLAGARVTGAGADRAGALCGALDLGGALCL